MHGVGEAEVGRVGFDKLWNRTTEKEQDGFVVGQRRQVSLRQLVGRRTERERERERDGER